MSTPRGTEQPSPVLSGLCLANRPLASFRERAPPSPEVTARPSAEEGRKRPAAVRGAAPREERSAEQRGAAARPRRPGIITGEPQLWNRFACLAEGPLGLPGPCGRLLLLLSGGAARCLCRWARLREGLPPRPAAAR